MPKEELSSEDQSADQGQDKNLANYKESTKPEAGHSRKPGLSKREIMEQLSRERFPWDE
jgi:hypothetical protein